jgi:hypothetical protein
MKNIFLVLCFLVTALNAQKGRPLQINESSHGNGAVVGLDLMAGNERGITILSNPANDHLLISVAGNQRERRNVTIVNASGQLMLKMANRTENTFMVNVSGFPKGMYFIEVASGSRSYRKKWICQ